MYLVGYILGPLLFGPLSETHGRRSIMVYSFAAFTIFTMTCAVAPNWGSLLFFRLATGVNASSPIAIIGGVYADIYGNPVTRGRAMAVFIGVSTKFLFSTPLLCGYESVKPSWTKGFSSLAQILSMIATRGLTRNFPIHDGL